MATTGMPSFGASGVAGVLSAAAGRVAGAVAGGGSVGRVGAGAWSWAVGAGLSGAGSALAVAPAVALGPSPGTTYAPAAPARASSATTRSAGRTRPATGRRTQSVIARLARRPPSTVAASRENFGGADRP